EGRSRFAAFEHAHAAFKRFPIWIVVTRVHESARVRAFDVALKRGGQINGRGHRPGCRIHLVSCVNGYGFDFHLWTLTNVTCPCRCCGVASAVLSGVLREKIECAEDSARYSIRA